jgi:hypothetical protein
MVLAAPDFKRLRIPVPDGPFPGWKISPEMVECSEGTEQQGQTAEQKTQYGKL